MAARVTRVGLMAALPLLIGLAACGGGDDGVSACELLPRADAERLLGQPLRVDPTRATKDEQRTSSVRVGKSTARVKRTRTVTVSDDASCRYIVDFGADPATNKPFFVFVSTYVAAVEDDTDLDALYTNVDRALATGALVDQREKPVREVVPELGDRAERWVSGDVVEYVVIGEGHAIDVTISRLDDKFAVAFARDLLAKLAAPPPGQS